MCLSLRLDTHLLLSRPRREIQMWSTFSLNTKPKSTYRLRFADVFSYCSVHVSEDIMYTIVVICVDRTQRSEYMPLLIRSRPEHDYWICVCGFQFTSCCLDVCVIRLMTLLWCSYIPRPPPTYIMELAYLRGKRLGQKHYVRWIPRVVALVCMLLYIIFVSVLL